MVHGEWIMVHCEGGIDFCFFVRETNGGTIIRIVDWKDDKSIIRGFEHGGAGHWRGEGRRGVLET
jgi:hypothetical protein